MFYDMIDVPYCAVLAMVVTVFVLNIVIFLGMAAQFLRTAKSKALEKIFELMESDTTISSITSFPLIVLVYTILTVASAFIGYILKSLLEIFISLHYNFKKPIYLVTCTAMYLWSNYSQRHIPCDRTAHSRSGTQTIGWCRPTVP